MNRVLGRLVLAAAVAMVACSKSPTGPQPGTILVKLQSPNSGADGAILFTLSGPTTVSNVQVGAAGDTLWSTDFSGTTSKVILTGAIASGVLLRVDVPDVNQFDQYLVSVNQVASSSDYSLRDLTNYVAFTSK